MMVKKQMNHRNSKSKNKRVNQCRIKAKKMQKKRGNKILIIESKAKNK